jgi:sugar/nucleoside kinase (ribokinase family)
VATTDDHKLDVVGLGNALVDVIATSSDDFLAAHGLVKGSMTLVDAARSDELYDAMGPALEASGGCVANTVAGIGSFGGRTAFIGKVRNDQMGEVFTHDIRSLGIEFDCPPASEGPPTGRCLIFRTPDAERTMNTFLGIAAELHPSDVDPALIARAGITYCEGYLWDVEITKQAIRDAMDASHASGGQVALTLSDGFCVDRHRVEWRRLVAERVDILFANADEIRSFFEVDDFAEAIDRVRGLVDLAFVTSGPNGSVVVAGSDLEPVAAEPVAEVVDTTGAGDQYAAGVLYGLTHGYEPPSAARLGSIAAAEVISHVGPRPAVSLASLLDPVA